MARMYKMARPAPKRRKRSGAEVREEGLAAARRLLLDGGPGAVTLANVGEAIGIALDTRRDRLYYTSLGGVLGTATLNGKHARLLLTNQGALTGIALLDEQ